MDKDECNKFARRCEELMEELEGFQERLGAEDAEHPLIDPVDAAIGSLETLSGALFREAAA